MIRDIINLLISYIRRSHYSLLDKKCRDLYFSKYGVMVPKMDILKTDLLLKYRIDFVYTKRVVPYKFRDISDDINDIYFLRDYSPEEKQIILGNIRTFTYDISYYKLAEWIKHLPNVVKMNGRISVGHRENLPILDKIENFNELGLKLYIDAMVNYSTALEKYKNIGTYNYASELCRHIMTETATSRDVYNEGHFYPKLQIIDNQYLPENANIRVPNLRVINTKNLIDTYILVQKYPTIKTVASVLWFDMSIFVDDQFDKVYTLLHEYDFDLRLSNGVVFTREHFDRLMDLEAKFSDESGKSGKPRIYRSLEALVNFVPTLEHWRLFDLHHVTIVE